MLKKNRHSIRSKFLCAFVSSQVTFLPIWCFACVLLFYTGFSAWPAPNVFLVGWLFGVVWSVLDDALFDFVYAPDTNDNVCD